MVNFLASADGNLNSLLSTVSILLYRGLFFLKLMANIVLHTKTLSQPAGGSGICNISRTSKP